MMWSGRLFTEKDAPHPFQGLQEASQNLVASNIYIEVQKKPQLQYDKAKQHEG